MLTLLFGQPALVELGGVQVLVVGRLDVEELLVHFELVPCARLGAVEVFSVARRQPRRLHTLERAAL